MAWRNRDPLVGPLKSALQKYIRRGEVDDAAAVARELEQRDQDSLARRLTVIAAEDVDWRLMPDVCLAAVTAMTPQDTLLDGQQPTLVEVAAALAAHPKQKEAAWLFITVLDHHIALAGKTPESLLRAIDVGDHVQAFAQAWAMVKDKRMVEVTMTLRSLELPPAAKEVVEWACWRARLGGVGVGEVLAAAVLGAVDRDQPRQSLRRVGFEQAPLRFPWYAFDGHTRIGKVALGKIAKREGSVLDQGHLGHLMFLYESIVLEPEVPGRWKREALEGAARKGGWMTVEYGEALWSMYRQDVKGFIEWLMRQENLPGRPDA